MEERQHGEVAVLGGDAPGLDERARVRREVPVREHRSLGAAGRARTCRRWRGGPVIPRDRPPWSCIPRDAGRDDGPEPEPRQSRPARLCGKLVHVPDGRPGGNEPREVGRRHDGHGLRVADDVADLALAVEDVDRHEDHAELQARQEEVEELEPVGELDGEAVAGTKPARCEDARHPAARAPRSRRTSASRPARPAGRARGPASARGRRATRRTGRAVGCAPRTKRSARVTLSLRRRHTGRSWSRVSGRGTSRAAAPRAPAGSWSAGRRSRRRRTAPPSRRRRSRRTGPADRSCSRPAGRRASGS